MKTMTNMDKRQEVVKFIEAYPNKKWNIEILRRKLARLDEMCYPDGVDPSKDKVSSSNIQDTVFQTAIRIEREREKLTSKLRLAEEYVELHDFAFARLSDTEQVVIAKLYHGARYIDGKNWLLSNGYPYRTIYSARERALDKMANVIFNDDEYVVIKRRRK